MDTVDADGIPAKGMTAGNMVVMPEEESALLGSPALPAFLSAVPHAFARLHLLLVVQTPDGPVLLNAAPCDPFARLNLQVHLGRMLPCRPVADEALAERIDAVYETHALGASRPEVVAAQAATGEDFARLLADTERDLLATDGKAPVVRLLDHLVFRAVQRGASDLHLQPVGDALIVRHRIDGVLGEGERLPVTLMGPIAARIKVIGRMDVSESLVPQDGRTSVTIGDRSIDVRISTMPTPHGERLVLRLLDSTKHLHDFPALGMPDLIADAFLAVSRRASGIVLVTGPTGSGKTTTLYATLRELDARERNIMTIEDPIEYELDALGLPISQSQVNAKKGVTFASGLRHILRQDPDIVLVGEIRDAETARIAIQSSLTGHLVFSTLHTNDAVTAVTRLFDLGVEPYLVASSLSAVLAQRLVRVHCTACRGAGCAVCQGSGFKGRRGIFELLTIDESLRRLIQRSAGLEDLREAALAAGMVPLIDTARRLVADGVTTQAEIDRVVHG
jgi:general secretion pathway protein E